MTHARKFGGISQRLAALALPLWLLSLWVPAAASADAFTSGRVSAGIVAGYGIAAQGDNLRNEYNASIGAQTGYTFGFGLYLGAIADYFIGDGETIAGTSLESIELTYDWSHLALEAGYDLPVNKIVLRPSVGFGAALLGTCFDDACQSNTFALIAPAITAVAPLGLHSYFSFTLRYFLVPGGDTDPHDGFMFGAGLGASL